MISYLFNLPTEVVQLIFPSLYPLGYALFFLLNVLGLYAVIAHDEYPLFSCSLSVRFAVSFICVLYISCPVASYSLLLISITFVVNLSYWLFFLSSLFSFRFLPPFILFCCSNPFIISLSFSLSQLLFSLFQGIAAELLSSNFLFFFQSSYFLDRGDLLPYILTSGETGPVRGVGSNDASGSSSHNSPLPFYVHFETFQSHTPLSHIDLNFMWEATTGWDSGLYNSTHKNQCEFLHRFQCHIRHPCYTFLIDTIQPGVTSREPISHFANAFRHLKY